MFLPSRITHPAPSKRRARASHFLRNLAVRDIAHLDSWEERKGPIALRIKLARFAECGRHVSEIRSRKSVRASRPLLFPCKIESAILEPLPHCLFSPD